MIGRAVIHTAHETDIRIWTRKAPGNKTLPSRNFEKFFKTLVRFQDPT